MSVTLSIERHDRLHCEILRTERLAAYTLASIRGRTAEEVAAEVAARAIQSLRAKHPAEAGRREVEP